ncbi:MAG TPA: alpha/beta fold hydrolase [Anaerolineales bacterium]|nr:alpha/beta fold hydrolase [Anaerolineales bacterium]
MSWWIFAFIVFSLLLWFAFRPIPIARLESHSQPVTNFEEAVTRVKAMQEADNQELARDVCITKLYDHGTQTDHVIILLHGFTSCPEQFNELGKQYFEVGHNVFIPRLPYHGLSDRLTDALVNLTARDLAGFGDTVIDIAHGLGKKITVIGISGSGTLVAWLAQNRKDVHYAVAIAPLLGLAFIPQALTKLFERFALHLPNFFLWWDPRTKANNPYSIYYAYPRYPIRALAEFLRLAMVTCSRAKEYPPAAGHFTMIINDAEPAVSNPEILKLFELWQKHGKRNLNEVHFEKEMKLPHDIITPGTPGVPIGDIHRRLIQAVKNIHANR